MVDLPDTMVDLSDSNLTATEQQLNSNLTAT